MVHFAVHKLRTSFSVSLTALHVVVFRISKELSIFSINCLFHLASIFYNNYPTHSPIACGNKAQCVMISMVSHYYTSRNNIKVPITGVVSRISRFSNNPRVGIFFIPELIFTWEITSV